MYYLFRNDFPCETKYTLTEHCDEVSIDLDLFKSCDSRVMRHCELLFLKNNKLESN